MVKSYYRIKNIEVHIRHMKYDYVPRLQSENMKVQTSVPSFKSTKNNYVMFLNYYMAFILVSKSILNLTIDSDTIFISIIKLFQSRLLSNSL